MRLSADLLRQAAEPRITAKQSLDQGGSGAKETDDDDRSLDRSILDLRPSRHQRLEE